MASVPGLGKLQFVGYRSGHFFGRPEGARKFGNEERCDGHTVSDPAESGEVPEIDFLSLPDLSLADEPTAVEGATFYRSFELSAKRPDGRRSRKLTVRSVSASAAAPVQAGANKVNQSSTLRIAIGMSIAQPTIHAMPPSGVTIPSLGVLVTTSK